MVGRQKELKQLRELMESPNSEFAALYGRRRIGKTYLVNEAFGYRFAFHHAGMKNATSAKQLKQFRLSLMQQGHEKCPALKDWQSAFFELEKFLDGLPSPRKIVFIDEMPWLDTPRSGFLSALESFWNYWASFRKDIVLIACGSATSWIVKNIIRNKDGLYGRVRTRIKLFPFTLAECEAYANDELHLGFGRSELAECYMVFGGVAYYWSLLERGKSPAQNIDALFFGPQDGLRTEYDELYRSLFRHPEKHLEVVRILGGRRDGFTREELIAKLNGVSGGDITRCLADLEECGFIRKYRTSANAKNGGVYQLIDAFTLFYRRFVDGNKVTSGDYWQRRLAEGAKNEWRGFAFERLCLMHIDQIKAALGISGVFTVAYSWRTADDAGKPAAQIDLLIDRQDGIVNLCEMKYSSDEYEIEKSEYERLQKRVAVFSASLPRKKSLHLTFVTMYGLKMNGYRHKVQSEVVLDDLFRG